MKRDYWRTSEGVWVDCCGRPARWWRRRRLDRRFGPFLPGPPPPGRGGDTSGDREPRRPRPTLPALAAHAELPPG